MRLHHTAGFPEVLYVYVHYLLVLVKEDEDGVVTWRLTLVELVHFRYFRCFIFNFCRFKISLLLHITGFFHLPDCQMQLVLSSFIANRQNL
jgi:hypothetical protein